MLQKQLKVFKKLKKNTISINRKHNNVVMYVDGESIPIGDVALKDMSGNGNHGISGNISNRYYSGASEVSGTIKVKIDKEKFDKIFYIPQASGASGTSDIGARITWV